MFEQWDAITPPAFKDARLLYFIISFTRGNSLTAHSEEILMGLQLAHAHFAAPRRIGYYTFVGLFNVSDLHLFTIENVVLAIRASLDLHPTQFLFIVLHLDDAQELLWYGTLFKRLV